MPHTEERVYARTFEKDTPARKGSEGALVIAGQPEGDTSVEITLYQIGYGNQVSVEFDYRQALEFAESIIAASCAAGWNNELQLSS